MQQQTGQLQPLCQKDDETQLPNIAAEMIDYDIPSVPEMPGVVIGGQDEEEKKDEEKKEEDETHGPKEGGISMMPQSSPSMTPATPRLPTPPPIVAPGDSDRRRGPSRKRIKKPKKLRFPVDSKPTMTAEETYLTWEDYEREHMIQRPQWVYYIHILRHNACVCLYGFVCERVGRAGGLLFCVLFLFGEMQKITNEKFRKITLFASKNIKHKKKHKI